MPRPGDRLGRYVLLDRIGAGGMAEVFLARQEGPAGFARRVAIKFVRPSGDEAEALQSLIDEARVAAQLQHPNVVQVIELDRYEDGFYLVMEFVQGWPLDDLLKLARANDRPADLEATVDLGLQLLDALGYAHDARAEDGSALRVVHRDVKPSNVIVDGRGLAKVVDFGIASAESIERRTATGIGKGTPGYMAPEQLHGRPAGPAADLFAVGVVLHEVATGQRLFTADNFMALITRRTEGYREEDSAVLTASMPTLAPVVARALAAEPDDRYGSAAEMAAELREVAAPSPRTALTAWMTRVLGDDPVEILVSASLGGGGPTHVPVVPTAAVDGNWIESADAGDVPATRLVTPRPGASGGHADATAEDADTVADDSLVTTRRWKHAGPVPVVLIIGLWALMGWVVWMIWPEAPPPAEADAVTPSATPETTPEPTPEGEATPAPAGGATPEATPAPVPAPEEATPKPDAEATPAPAAASAGEATPEDAAEPTPSEVAAADVAPGSLSVALIGFGGTVEVDGYGSRAAPTGEMRVAAGVRTVRLLSREGGLLETVRVEVRSGEVSRCAWRMQDGQLVAYPDPGGAPCRLR